MSDSTIPLGLCQCGCGEFAGFYAYSQTRDGVKKGDPKKFVHGHNMGAGTPPEERFWEKVDKNGPNGCWVWTASKRKGYGMFQPASRSMPSHRWSYEVENGPIPDGMVLDHLCRNRACVNPDHLEVVTNRENILRGKGQTAVNARKTHCVHGHEFTPENTMKNGSGRKCRTCDEKRNGERKR